MIYFLFSIKNKCPASKELSYSLAWRWGAWRGWCWRSRRRPPSTCPSLRRRRSEGQFSFFWMQRHLHITDLFPQSNSLSLAHILTVRPVTPVAWFHIARSFELVFVLYWVINKHDTSYKCKTMLQVWHT